MPNQGIWWAAARPCLAMMIGQAKLCLSMIVLSTTTKLCLSMIVHELCLSMIICP